MGKGQGRGAGKGAMNGSAQQPQPSTYVYMPHPGPPVVTATNPGRPAYRDKTERIAVPAMPMPAAIVCCILNFLIPGFGTVCAGFSAFCCSRNEDIEGSGRCVSCLINWGIGFAQLLTFVLCFIGWFWSCAWGVFFIGMSLEYYHNRRIAADGGYIDRPPNGSAVIVTTQPTPQPATFATQPVYPPTYSTLTPQADPVKGSGPPPYPTAQTALPPPYQY